MKVTGRDEVSKYANQRALAPNNETPEEARKRSEVVRESHEDAVCSFSQRSKDVQKAHEAIQSEPDVRMGRVQTVRAKIEKGTYEIDFDKTAEKMLKTFTDEIS
ncbi:MAG: flagellar biosynthesis anti-sigma factor FlgM [Deltaproteobacteria bacterium]|nr:flagellar biosynthesis anti-sigma factor FlgM [Deltaproteobacteria bacterium]